MLEFEKGLQEYGISGEAVKIDRKKRPSSNRYR